MNTRHALSTRHYSTEISIMAANPANHENPGFGRTGASPEKFEAFVDQALRERAGGTPGVPSPIDLEARQLVRYAAGRTEGDDRLSIQDLVQRSPWSYDRVVSLVKAKRPGQSGLAGALARRLLDPAERPAREVAAAAVLELDGKLATTETADGKRFGELLEKVSGRARAACLIGMNRLADAKKTLDSSNEKNDATSKLLKSLLRDTARDTNEDESLVALLDAFPALLGDNHR